MKRTKRLVATAMIFVFTITCFCLNSYAANNTSTFLESDNFDFCIADAVKSTSLYVNVDKDGALENILQVELDDEKYGFDVWSALKSAVTTSSDTQELAGKLTDIANAAVEPVEPRIDPTANVTKVYHYGVEDSEGDDMFCATVTVDATIDNVDVELSGWADALTSYDIDITDNTATVLFYNPLISSDYFLEVTYSIANNGRITDDYNFLP